MASFTTSFTSPRIIECMTNFTPWKVLTSFHDYKIATREVCRIDFQNLPHIHPDKFKLFDQWEKNLKLRQTRHFFDERLRQYVNKPSRNGRYIELTSNEYTEILTTNLEHEIISRNASLVELGFNGQGQICKAAYVYQLKSLRFLFFCVGMDYGLKTAYVTPKFKYRSQYQGMRYLTLEEAMAM
jgi:hypothetical protein